MFCQKCGNAVLETALACPSCSAPMAVTAGARLGGAASSAAVAATLKTTSKDAFTAFKTFAGNPVGGLQPAYDALGPAGALRTGLAFGVVSLLCFLLGGYLLLPPFFREDLFDVLGFGGVMKCLLFAVMPFLCATVGGLGLRKLLGGRGSLGADAFIAGSALLPASLAMLLSGFVGFENQDLIGVLAVVAGCVGILMLFTGYTRVVKLSERMGALGVPAVVLFTLWLSKVLAASVLGGPEINMGYPSDFPY